MESDARPPQKLSNPNNWNRFKKDFEVYMKITNGYEKPEDVQVAWLLNFMGPIGLKALEKIIFNDPEDEKKLTIVIEKLDVFFNPAKNVIEERYKFFSKSKKGNESIDIFILDLLEISKFCNFGEQAENLVRDVVLLNIKEKHLRELLFTENDLNLEKLKVIIKTYEINSKKIEQVSKELMSLQTGSENKTVNSSAPKRPQSASRRPRSTSRKPSFSKNDSSKEFTKGCWKCGRVHPLGRCPAFKAECVYCNRPNHFSHCCPIAKLEGVKVTPKNPVEEGEKIKKQELEIIELKNQEKMDNNGNKKFSYRTQAKNSDTKPSAPILPLMDLTFEEFPPTYNSLYPDLSQKSEETTASHQNTSGPVNKPQNHDSRRKDKLREKDNQECAVQ